MDRLSGLIKSHEDWLIGRILEYAKKHGYVQYSSTLREAWRISIAGLSNSIIRALATDPLVPDLHPDDDYGTSPIVAFGAAEAAKHRQRGVSLGMFLSLLKYYRQAYQDLALEAKFEPEYHDYCRRFIDRAFDRIEIGFAGEWATASEGENLEELQFTGRRLTEEKNKYLTIFESLSIPVIVLDHENRIENLNRAASSLLFGDTTPGQSYYSRPHKQELIPWLAERLDGWLDGEDEVSFEIELSVQEDKRLFDVTVSPMLDVTDQHSGSIVVMNDVTERKLAEEATRRSRDFYLTLFEDFPSLVWRSGIDAKCDYFNRSWLDFTGRSLEDSIGDGWLDQIHPDDRIKWVRRYLECFAACEPLEMDFRLLDSQRHYSWVHAYARPYYDLSGQFAGYIGTCHDITERKRQEEQLAYMAIHDSLTCLPNRRYFEEALSRAVAAAKRGTCSAMLFMDIDFFKLINDTFGHAVGDEVLVTIGRVVSRHLRGEDLLSRLAGDEFAILLHGTTVEEAHVIAERIRQAIGEFIFIFNRQEFQLSISIGIASIDGRSDAAAVMTNADSAMYMAKERNRNCVIVFGPGLHTGDGHFRGGASAS